MPTRLDPLHLTPAASLNRVLIVTLPSDAPAPDVRSLTGYDLLSTHTLAATIRGRATDLSLLNVATLDDAALPPALDVRLAAPDPNIRQAATDITRRFGRSLGYLLVTLKLGDPANRAARPDWDDSYWAHWAAVHTVWLGGGLVSGRLAAPIAHHAAAVLSECAITDLTLALSPHPVILPLLGAARSARRSSTAALVLDFGGTAVKRAVAIYANGTLTGLRRLHPQPAPRLAAPDSASPADVERLATALADILADAWREAAALAHPLSPRVVISLAAYIRGGRPLARQGSVYAQLHHLPISAARWLSRAVSASVGTPIEVVLLHDGTAAARAYAGAIGADHTAVILLGTALGVGFPPPVRGLLPIASDLDVAPFR